MKKTAVSFRLSEKTMNELEEIQRDYSIDRTKIVELAIHLFHAMPGLGVIADEVLP